jgi:hypothetical protein
VRSIGYDNLVIAIGSISNDFGTPGVAICLDTPEQAQRFNRRLVNACPRAHTQVERCGRASCMSPSSAPGRPTPNYRRNCTAPGGPPGDLPFHNCPRAGIPVALMPQWRQKHPNNRPPTRATAISEMGQCTKSLRDSPLRGGLREAQ